MRRLSSAAAAESASRSLRAPLVAAVAFGLAACAGTAPREGAEFHGSAVASALSAIDDGAGLDLRLARATRNAGDLESAANLYREAMARNPGNPQIAIELGAVLIDSGQPEQAIDLFATVSGAAERPDISIRAERGIGRAYLVMQNAQAALDHFILARDKAAQDPRSLVDCGVALDLLRRHAEAQESYRAALQVAPHDTGARNDLALSLALTRQYDAALEIIVPVARSAAATPQIRQNLALIYGLKGDGNAADAISRVDLDPVATSSNVKLFSALRDGFAGSGPANGSAR
jgi:Flp pilus assembly protein TadD